MKLFKVIYYIFVGCLAIIALLLIVSIFPITGNFKVMTVLSGSMEPAIKTGSIVVVKPADSYKINQVITFTNPSRKNEPITHRIVEMEVIEGNPLYITQGDANNAPDQQKVQPREIIGRLLLDIPYLGYTVETAKKPFGFMLIIVVPAVIIIYDEFRKIWREIKKLRNKKKDNQQDQKIEKLEEEVDELEDKIKEE